jgi:hydrogenase nickel incorporation protein HypA/HybF
VHELSITQAVVDTVVAQLGDAPVRTVHLRIGRDSGVVPDAVRFCFERCAAGTPVAGARLEIDQPPGVAVCNVCGIDFPAEEVFGGCRCGSLDVRLDLGHDLVVTKVETG